MDDVRAALGRGRGDALASLAERVARRADRLSAEEVLAALAGAAAACGAENLTRCAAVLSAAVHVGDEDGARAAAYLAHWCPLLVREWAEQAEAGLRAARRGGGVRVRVAGGRDLRVRPEGQWDGSGEHRLRGGESVGVLSGSGHWAEAVLRQPPPSPSAEISLVVLAAGAGFAEAASRRETFTLHVLCPRLPFERQMDALACVVTGTGCDAAVRGALLRSPCGGSRPPTADVEVLASLPHMPGGEPAQQQSADAALNGPQRAAVQRALRRKVSLVQGPPGTGKTRTAVAVVRAWLAAGHRLVLAAADSNAGVDNLLDALHRGGVKAVRCGVTDSVPERLRHLCVDGGGDGASRRALQDAGVVCTTLSVAAGGLVRGLPFTACVVDEAAQATEPATLCAVQTGCAQLCLVGDHRQLPATVLSCTAEREGLGRSLFERLCDAGCTVTMLTRQFRMHPVLAEFSSGRWYGGRLVSMVTPADRPTPRYLRGAPVLFVPVAGSESRDGPSLYNEREAEAVAEAVRGLVAGGVSAAAVGCVTPYAAQTRVLRRMVPRGVEVGTADSYQGREKEAIVVSPVRSGGSVSAFAGDPRRLNVSLTRARRAVVVVGDRGTLAKDREWREWLEWVSRAGFVRGGGEGTDAALVDRLARLCKRGPPADDEVVAADAVPACREWVRHWGDDGGTQYSIAVRDFGGAWLLDSGAVVDKADCVAEGDGGGDAPPPQPPGRQVPPPRPGSADPETLESALRRALTAAARMDTDAGTDAADSRWAWALSSVMACSGRAAAAPTVDVDGGADDGAADMRRDALARRLCGAARWLREPPRLHCVFCRKTYQTESALAAGCCHPDSFLPPAPAEQAEQARWAEGWLRRAAEEGGVPSAKRARTEEQGQLPAPESEEQKWTCVICGSMRLLGSAQTRRTRRAGCGKCKTKTTFEAFGAPPPAAAPAAAAAVCVDDGDDDVICID